MKQQIKKTAQAGFTLIELIVVIVILGILAATALPKFMDMGGDARVGSLNAAQAALKSTAAMAHGRWLVNPAATYTAEGVTYTVDATSGYPDATDDFAKAAGLGDDYQLLTTVGNATASAPAVAAGELVIIPKSVQGKPQGLTCFIRYTKSSTLNTPPTYSVVPAPNAC
jgi:MSHA pilin protein MshA